MSWFPKLRNSHTPDNRVPLRDYIEQIRAVDILSFENVILRIEIEQIRSTDQAKIRDEISQIRDSSYNLFKRLEMLLK